MKTLLALLILALMGCGTSPSNGSGSILYAYGDSITWGAAHPSYIDNISALMNVPALDKAVSGTSMFSPNQYSQMIFDSKNLWKSGDIIIFLPGHNDVVSSVVSENKVHMDLYAQDLNEILQAIGSVKGLRAYIGTTMDDCEDSDNLNPIMDMYAQINRDAVILANNQNITTVDFNTNVQLTPTNTKDCIHPNAQGYGLMTQVFFNTVK